MQIDPVRDIMLVVARALNGIYAIDPSAPDRDIAPLACAGDRPVITAYAAIEYAPNLDQFVYYSANDGPQIYSITAPAGSTWSQLVSGTWNWRSVRNQNTTRTRCMRSDFLARRQYKPHVWTISRR